MGSYSQSTAESSKKRANSRFSRLITNAARRRSSFTSPGEEMKILSGCAMGLQPCTATKVKRPLNPVKLRLMSGKIGGYPCDVLICCGSRSSYGRAGCGDWLFKSYPHCRLNPQDTGSVVVHFTNTVRLCPLECMPRGGQTLGSGCQ